MLVESSDLELEVVDQGLAMILADLSGVAETDSTKLTSATASDRW